MPKTKPRRARPVKKGRPLKSADTPDAHVVNIKKCARCGDSHSGITLRKLQRPSGVYTHWCPCPTTHEPILSAFLS